MNFILGIFKGIWNEVYKFGNWFLDNKDVRNGFVVGVIVGIGLTLVFQWV